MNITKPIISALFVVVAALALPTAATAQSAAAASAPAAAASAPEQVGPGTEYSEKGADTCLNCHDADADTATFTTAAIFKTRHAQRGRAHTPFGAGGLQCEACHGPGARHASKGSKKVGTINSFKANSFMTPEQRNVPCLGCHQSDARNGWHAGAHERSDLACTDCHRLHVQDDPVLAEDDPARCLLHLPQAAARGVLQDLVAPGALRRHGAAATATTRTVRPTARC